MKPIFRILRYLRFFPWQIGFNIAFNLLHIIFNLGSYVMIVPFVELLFGNSNSPLAEPELTLTQDGIAQWAFWHLNHMRDEIGLMNCLIYIGGGYLTCVLLSNLFRYLGLIFLSQIRNGVIEHLRNDLYDRITTLPIAFFGSSRRGDLISRMANDLTDIEWSVVSTLQSLVKDPINIIVFCATLLFVSWQLFVLFLVVLPVGVWLIARIGASLKRNSQRGQNMLGSLFATLEESLSGIKIIKVFRAEDCMAARFAAQNEGYTHTMVRVAARRELSSPLSEILGTLALVIILIIGGSWVVGGHIMPSVFIFFVIVFARLIPPIQAVVRAYNSLQKGSASAVRILEVTESPYPPDNHSAGLPLPIQSVPGHSGIELEGVCFTYPDAEDETLHDISLAIPHGAHIAIVGSSGGGKSTLVELLPRFHDVSGGRILFDGHDIRTLNIRDLRSQFGIVSQDCFLFNDSIAANIAFGSTNFTPEQIRDAARAADIDDFIQSLPEGYNTIVGDRGQTLSGGQRQRISIARALLRDTKILIFDEATSALDSESELSVQKSLEKAAQGRTTITIAHRLSTIRTADRIFVVAGGRVVQSGTHDQLMAQTDGLYHKMATL